MNAAEAARKVALAMAGGRAVIGVGMAVAPQPVAMTWIGRRGRSSGAQLLARGLGGRDAALGLGALAALARRKDERTWVAAQLAADLTDLAATALAGDDFPAPGRKLVLGVAGGASVIGAATLVALGSRGGPGTTSDERDEVTVPAASSAPGLGDVVIGGETEDRAPMGGDRLA